MRRIMSFLEEGAGKELVLPVTPASYTWEHANRVETIQLDRLGEINLPGGALMGSCTLSDVLLPARLYSFCNPGAVANPYIYLEQLERWSDAGTVVRWLVSGTPTNAQVLLESISYGERDGTNDLYAAIILRQYRKPETPVLKCYNKADLVYSDDIPVGKNIVAISAKRGINMDGLLKAIESALNHARHHIVVRLPYAMGGMVETLHDGAQVKKVDYTPEGIEIEAVVDGILYGRLREYIIGEC